MIDPAECRRLAQECAEDDATIRRIDAEFSKPGGVEANPRMRSEIAKATLRIRDNAAAIASALTDAAELAERHDRHSARCQPALQSLASACEDSDRRLAEVTAERDAALAEVERLRAGIREELANPPTILDERKDLMIRVRLRKLLGDP